MTLGEILKDTRKRFGLSQEELAEIMHVSRQAITKWETDKGMPDIANLQELAKVFGVTVDYFLNADSRQGMKPLMNEYNKEIPISRDYLTNGEHVLWKGRPGKGRLLSKIDIFLIPFSIVWCGFVFFWEYMVISLEGPFFFSLFGLPFIILGLYFVLGRFLLLAYLRKQTFYILTTEKIIRRCGKKIDYLSIKNLPCVYVTTHKNGYGTISFEPQSLLTIVEWMNVFYFTKKGFSLENIQNVVHVQKMILDAQKKKL